MPVWAEGGLCVCVSDLALGRTQGSEKGRHEVSEDHCLSGLPQGWHMDAPALWGKSSSCLERSEAKISRLIPNCRAEFGISSRSLASLAARPSPPIRWLNAFAWPHWHIHTNFQKK